MNIVVLTGAGISQESGLSTFRGGGGLWEDHQVDDVSTAKALQKNPDLVYRFFDERRAALDAVEPNLAHMALSKLEWHWREGRKGSFLLITQNVDDLHERAGSAELIHMHGALKSALCPSCGARRPWDGPMVSRPNCSSCGRDWLRPDIVLFEEMPYQLGRIDKALKACSLFVSIGTSGAVYPACDFVRTAKSYAAKTLEINLEASEVSADFDEVRRGYAGALVPEWVEGMIGDLDGGPF